MSENKKSPFITSTHQIPSESSIQTKIQEVFEIFDHEQNNTVDIREIGTIIRGLGYCPSEAELQGVLRDVEEPHQRGYAHIDRFLPTMLNVIQQRRFLPASPDEVLKAFKVIDKESSSKSEIDAEYFRRLLTEKGEHFTHEEVDELMKVAINPSTGKVAYQIPPLSNIEIRKGTEADYSQNMKELWDLEDYSTSFLNDDFEQDPREKIYDIHWKEVVNMDLLNENTFFELRIGLPNEDPRTFDIDISTSTLTLFSHKYKVKYFFPNEVESKPIFCKWKKDQCILEIVLNPK